MYDVKVGMCVMGFCVAVGGCCSTLELYLKEDFMYSSYVISSFLISFAREKIFI